MKNNTISRVMRAMGKKGGKAGGPKGGRARMHRLTPQERTELARKAAAARWGNTPNNGRVCAQSGTLGTAPGLAASQEFARRTRLSEFIEQAKDIAREWKPIVAFGSAESRSDEDVIGDAERDRFRYLHSGPDAHRILQCRFLLTCQELEVPTAKWPKFGTVVLRDPMRLLIEMPPFVPPPFDAQRDSATWHEAVDSVWKEYCKTCLAKIRRQIDLLAGPVKVGADVAAKPMATILIRQKQTRETGRSSPRTLRLKWAVLHHCQGLSYGRIYNNPKYNPERTYKIDAIIKATQKLLDELKLR